MSFQNYKELAIRPVSYRTARSGRVWNCISQFSLVCFTTPIFCSSAFSLGSSSFGGVWITSRIHLSVTLNSPAIC